RRLTLLTTATADTQWAAPRWSPDGTHIAAVRLANGRNALVVLDTMGRVLRTVFEASSVVRSPAWSRDGRRIFFTADYEGVSQVYSVSSDGRNRSVSRYTE